MMEFVDDRNGFNWFMFLEIGLRKLIVHKLASFNSSIVIEPENKHGTNMERKHNCVQTEVIKFSSYKRKICIINSFMMCLRFKWLVQFHNCDNKSDL